ncbi:hypothetical protein EDF60_0049 [Leucobacter luti]|nr:hypothetical protein EDF60_0049 [Leucobacter luti]
MLSCVSFASGTNSSSKKLKCCVVQPRISRRRIYLERFYPLVTELTSDGILALLIGAGVLLLSGGAALSTRITRKRRK